MNPNFLENQDTKQFNPTFINTVECYNLAEERAYDYFQSLYGLVTNKTYILSLTKDIQSWKYNHIHHPSLLSSIFGGNRRADDVDFFDKLLRDEVITLWKKEKAEQEAFMNTVKTVNDQISDILKIHKTNIDPILSQTIVDAANYSLEAGGKQVRPLMAWAMGVNGYGLDPKAMEPLL